MKNVDFSQPIEAVNNKPRIKVCQLDGIWFREVDGQWVAMQALSPMLEPARRLAAVRTRARIKRYCERMVLINRNEGY